MQRERLGARIPSSLLFLEIPSPMSPAMPALHPWHDGLRMSAMSWELPRASWFAAIAMEGQRARQALGAAATQPVSCRQGSRCQCFAPWQRLQLHVTGLRHPLCLHSPHLYPWECQKLETTGQGVTAKPPNQTPARLTTSPGGPPLGQRSTQQWPEDAPEAYLSRLQGSDSDCQWEPEDIEA